MSTAVISYLRNSQDSHSHSNST